MNMDREINSKVVKELREKTGAGMMACKKALQESNGDLIKAAEALRQKGLALTDKKSSRTTSEGLIESYIHTGQQLGVLVEVQCETDFVARSAAFGSLTKDIAMQIAASPLVKYVSMDKIPESLIEKEKEIELGKEDLVNKPLEIKEKIVAGRVEKLLKTQILLEQPFIRDPNVTIDELIKKSIALLGENIRVGRFVRVELGE